jgi:tetratricopeptide (TPR) repeat protein
MPDVERNFQQANQRVAAQDYGGAVALLEEAVKQAAIPVIFNDLGVLYAELNDRSRAIYAFREALARDIDYQPVRFNLERLKGFTTQDTGPVTHEIEPNNRSGLANLMAMDKPVDGEISEGANDVDYYRITTPPLPRDIVSIEIQARSKTLAPVLSMYDRDQRLLDFGKEMRQPGASLTQYISPEPGATLYLAVSGYGSSSGQYTLLVRQLKAFDAYEPNDDIFGARTIATGASIEANIMDASDTDFYSFAAPRTGIITINIRNRSATLIPALSTFTPDKISSGFGPDVHTAGSNLKHAMDVLEGQTYYIQVWSQNRTAGDYSLTVQ